MEKENKYLSVFEKLLLIVYIVCSQIYFYLGVESFLAGLFISAVLTGILVLKPEIKFTDKFIRNFTIGAGIIALTLFLLLDSLQEEDSIRNFPFIMYFLGGFASAAVLIRLFRTDELKQKRSVFGFSTLILFFGAGIRQAGPVRIILLITSLLILSLNLMFEIIFIHKKQSHHQKIPGIYFILLMIVILISGGLTGGSLYIMPGLVKMVDRNLSQSFSALSGFSNISRLGDIQNIKLSKQVIMRVYGDAPFYLRGNVYEDLNNKNNYYDWLSKLNYSTRTDPQGNFILRPELTDNPNLRVCRIALRISNRNRQGILFNPHNPVIYQASIDQLNYDLKRDISKITERRSFLEYKVSYVTNRETRLESEEEYLYLKDNIRNKFRDLADLIKGDAEDDILKIQRLSDYFKKNKFQYSLSVNTPRNKDPILYFLTESREGWCEYYATSAVILLRLMGVKTRYVSGFLIAEESEDGEYFIVRTLHAHSWVEFYDAEQNQWKSYDPTSLASGFRPDEGYQPRKFELMLENILFKWDSFKNTLKSFSLENLRDRLQELISDWIFNLALLILVILYVIFRLVFSKEPVKFRLFKWKSKPNTVESPELIAWHQLLEKLDRLFSQISLPREPHMTWMEFLSSVEDKDISPELLNLANELIHDFYLFRFRGDKISEERIEDFRNKLF